MGSTVGCTDGGENWRREPLRFGSLRAASAGPEGDRPANDGGGNGLFLRGLGPGPKGPAAYLGGQGGGVNSVGVNN